MPFLGELSALFTACLWSVGALIFGVATRRFGSFQVNIVRQMVAEAMLILWILLMGYTMNLSANQYLKLALSGVIGLALGDTFLFKAFQEIGPRVSMLVMSLAPAIAALLAYLFLGEILSTPGIVGIVMTLAGVAIVVLEPHEVETTRIRVTPMGLLFAFLGAIGQGAGLIVAKSAFSEGAVNGFTATAVRIFGSLLIMIPMGYLTGRGPRPMEMFRDDRRVFFLVCLAAFLGSFLGISFSLIAIEHTEVGIAATIMALVPILMLPLIRIFYKEHLSWRAIGGSILAVAGVAVLFLR